MSFDAFPIISYLQLEPDSKPSPVDEPLEFLKKYVTQLPPQLLETFSDIVPPKQRTLIPVVRNRRYKYTLSEPEELEVSEARRTWPTLWRGARDRRREQQEAAADERQWAEKEFLNGRKQHIGKLASLLGDYAGEIEGERLRELGRAHAERQPDFIPDEEDSDESEFEAELAKTQAAMPESPEEAKDHFQRLIRERFIYGLLDSIDYDAVDWNDKWDDDSVQESENRWFDDEEETEVDCRNQSTGEYDY